MAQRLRNLDRSARPISLSRRLEGAQARPTTASIRTLAPHIRRRGSPMCFSVITEIVTRSHVALLKHGVGGNLVVKEVELYDRAGEAIHS